MQDPQSGTKDPFPYKAKLNMDEALAFLAANGLKLAKATLYGYQRDSKGPDRETFAGKLVYRKDALLEWAAQHTSKSYVRGRKPVLSAPVTIADILAATMVVK